MKTKPLLSFFLVFIGLVPAGYAGSGEPGRCIFKIEALSEHGGATPIGEPFTGTSIVLFMQPNGNIYGLRHAPWLKNDDTFGGGEEFTRRIHEVFKRAKLRDFDLDTCIADTKAGLFAKPLDVYSGFATLKVFADMEGTSFSFTSCAVREKVERYAKYNPKLAQLKAILDEIAYEVGRRFELGAMLNQPVRPTRSARG